MNIIYPDFAFATSTQIVLFFVNITVTTMAYYWGANLLLENGEQKVNFKRKLYFSSISAILLHILVVYGFSFVNGWLTHAHRLDIGPFIGMTKTMFPFAYFVLYWLGIRVLNLSPIRSIRMMQFAYVYYVCCILGMKVVSQTLFVRQSDPRGWNFLRDIYVLILGAVVIYILYRAVYYAANRLKFSIMFSDNMTVKSIPAELGKNFLICCVIYGSVTAIYYYSGLDNIHCLLLLLVFMSYLVLSVLLEYVKIYRQNLDNRDEHITALNQSIEEFRGIKHDFNNILQTYSGYLTIKAYDQLNNYHQRMVGTTLFAENYLDLSQRIPENPSFFSLLIKKLEYAHLREASFEVMVICEMTQVYMNELDFCRIMSILLDNAIEESQNGSQKRIGFSAQRKLDDSLLFILSNDTVEEIEVDDIFTPGFTTKPGHSGQGLPQVRKILSRYGNCTLNITCYKKNFTAYLEIKPKDAC